MAAEPATTAAFTKLFILPPDREEEEEEEEEEEKSHDFFMTLIGIVGNLPLGTTKGKEENGFDRRSRDEMFRGKKNGIYEVSTRPGSCLSGF